MRFKNFKDFLRTYGIVALPIILFMVMIAGITAVPLMTYAVGPSENVAVIADGFAASAAHPLPVTCDVEGITIAAVTQSGTWTVQPGDTANTTAWLVTGTGGTFPSTQSGTWTVQPGNTPNTTPWLTKFPTTADPCQDPMIAKSSAVINIGEAATTYIVTTSTTKVIYVCGFTASLAGTTPTVTFLSGTHTSTDCDTGAVTLSGAFKPTSGGMIALTGQGSIMKSGAGGQICATTTGTGSSFQGIMSYVQQ